MIVEAEKDWILRAKTGWEGRHGWWVGWVEWSAGPVFFALNIDTPNRWEDLYKRGYSAGHSYIHSSTTASTNQCSRPLKRRLIEALVGRLRRRGKRNQTILAAKEKNPLRWRTGKVRIYDALPVSMSCRPLSKKA